ncbi:hypothetical protein A2U01_0068734, partial [Trifolium medium]|nr:hypothetical protein [Trifolium medium]
EVASMSSQGFNIPESLEKNPLVDVKK